MKDYVKPSSTIPARERLSVSELPRRQAPRGVCRTLEDADAVLDALGSYLAAARESLRLGRAFVGPDAEEEWNDLPFTLPANALRTYGPRKRPRIREDLADAADIWDAV